MAREIPNISVIIPLYNAEKYISETLNSLVGQTLQNFEVIVVDDCSTDHSAEVVKSFIPNFGGRLKYFKLEKNSGGPSVPRNRGLELAIGKYIFFMDNDDVIVESGLEALYNFAEKYQADAVYCEKWGEAPGKLEDIAKNIKIYGSNDTTEPTFFNENLETRLQAWIDKRIAVMSWIKLVKREILIENEIKFPSIIQEDSIWSFEIFMSAKKFLLLPKFYYVHRIHESSLAAYSSLQQVSSAENVCRKIDRTINGIAEFDEWLGKREFFRQHSDLRYLAVENFIDIDMNWARGDYFESSPSEVYDGKKIFWRVDGRKFYTDNVPLYAVFNADERSCRIKSATRRRYSIFGSA